MFNETIRVFSSCYFLLKKTPAFNHDGFWVGIMLELTLGIFLPLQFYLLQLSDTGTGIVDSSFQVILIHDILLKW